MTDVSRRTFLRGAGVVGGAAVVGGGSMAFDAGPVQEAEAFVCGGVCVAGGIALGGAVAGAAVGWALREYEVLGSDDPAMGLTPDALEQRVYDIALTRESTNASTFVDNQNLLNNVQNAAYADAKIAAIEVLNNEETEANVLAAGKANADDYETTVKQNQLKTWNESVREFRSYVQSVSNHADLTLSDVIDVAPVYGNEISGNCPLDDISVIESSVSHELPDGSTMDVEEVKFEFVTGTDNCTYGNTTHYSSWSPVGDWQKDVMKSDSVSHIPVLTTAGGVNYLDYSNWSSLFNSTTTIFDNVRSGLETWVSNVYGQVQSGDLDTSELLTPREMAEMQSDEEGFNQAIADLMALNISVDLEREAEIHIPSAGATLYGSIGTTGDTTLSTGTIDPSADALDYYLTYDASLAEGTWDALDGNGVDGGTVTFTSEPFSGVSYELTTGAGETVSFTASDFTDNGDGTWTVDLSADLETAVSTVESLNYFSETMETDYQTVQLVEPFEIVTFTDSDGNEHDSSEFTSSEPQDDTNYITKEEWDAQQQRYEELIAKYEESKSGGALPGLFEGGGGIGVVAVGAAIVAFLIGR